MALIKCPECGKEISDKSKACIHCGYPFGSDVELMDDISKNRDTDPVVQENLYQEPLPTDNSIAEKTNGLNSMNKKNMYGLFAFLGIIIVIFIIVVVNKNEKKCEQSNCDNLKQSGSSYCSEHACIEEGCTLSRDLYFNRCYLHQKEYLCAVEDCDDEKIDGGDYCSIHNCKEVGCKKEKAAGRNYCSEHTIDMKEQLTLDTFSFSLNSAGGIELQFSAKNSTGKEIKYVRFDVELRNAVGDRVEDEIKNTNTVSVEIVGPITPGRGLSMWNEIIGYCDTCARLDIKDITIIFTDGTSRTGYFGYYTEI